MPDNLPHSSTEERAFILIADDVPTNIQILEGILSANGFRYAIATNGVKALKLAQQYIPDLILLDIMMPEMDGYEVCTELKKIKQTMDIPIFFLTSRTEPEDIVKGFEVGGTDYITKPFNAKELLARIKTHLEIIKINNKLRELLHVMCHDMANVFTPISFELDALEYGYGTLEESLKNIQSSVDNGLGLIQLIRKIRDVEEHHRQIVLAPVNLKAAVNESLFILKQTFLDKHIEPDIDVDENIMVTAEKTSLINSVINNAFTNAIKFSFPNSIIHVRAHRSNDLVRVSIQDHGIGMPLDLQKNLFKMKSETSREGTRGEMGTGYGMPLAYKFMRTYGGTIEVFSREKKTDSENHGTEIRLCFKCDHR